MPATRDSLAIAAQIVRGGGLVAFPTDTVYGLGCDPLNELAVTRLFAAKGREGKPIPVLCDRIESALSLVRMDGTALSLAREHWPGALTIVAPLKVKVPPLLDQGSGWLGVRVPANQFCISLLGQVDGRMTGTSANVSGRPSCRSAAEVERALGGLVDLILDGGTLHGTESTVVRVTDGSVEVLRRGGLALKSGRKGRNSE